MRIYCTTCAHKGRISSRETITRTYVKLYCQCLDAKCGHTWVSNLAFDHTLRPSALHQELHDATHLAAQIRNLPAEKQRELFEHLGQRVA
ncbi:transcriptional regulator [Pseudomonas asturiensis]|uniref:Transcriptional regulator n=1 Tax=Pseudomonas asturiensis TaxID=1190415 RepID=A0ABX6H6S2_9PSED|nr:ogr/Delta-like zinc finger family protein [Pseudomonas asturiensis]QHF01215.1 transcriptional regulator [Pseudomonas asturiensis]